MHFAELKFGAGRWGTKLDMWTMLGRKAFAMAALAGIWTGAVWAGEAAPPAKQPAAEKPVAAPPVPAPAPAPAAKPAAPAPANQATTGGWQTERDPGGVTLDEKQTETVKKVSEYFANLNTLKGDFVQTGADKKRMKGKFFVKRPGRFRFDYALPSKQIIVSDGEYLAIQDLDLNNEDRVSLDQTPFRLLLRKDVDLLRDARITEVQMADDLIVLGLQDKSPDTPGTIRLFLTTKPSLELKEWVTTDAQGLDTRIEISQLVNSEELDANLFKIQMLGPKRGTP